MAEGRPNTYPLSVHPRLAEEIHGLSDKQLHSAVVELEAWSRRTPVPSIGPDRVTEWIMGAVIVEESIRVCATEP